DPADPSWALLGRFAQEERVVQVAGRLRFLADDLNAPADEFFKSAAPLVAGHPLYPYLESHVIDPKRWPDEYRDRLRADRVPALSYRHLPVIVAQRRLGRDAATRATHVAQAHGDWLYYDSALALRASLDGQDRTPLAHRLLWVSPHAPIARAALIRSDTAIPEAMLATWELEAQHPEIFEALAGRAFRAGRWEDVNRYFRRALELSPDVTLYRLVAEGYKARGDMAGWVATLESFLRTDDPGLDHARVRVDLAYHFLAAKDYPRAHGYAEAAAESGAPFALRCAARCADAAGEWAKAEAHARRLSEQFPDALAAWLIWCHRTGKGDAAAAAKLVEDRLGRVTGNPTADELQTAAALRALTGKVDLAPELLFAAHQRKRDDGALLLAASLSDTLKDTGSRERYLAFLTDDRSPYIAIKLFLARAQDDGEEVRPVADSVARLVRATPPGARVLACYIGGMYALRRGEAKVATEYLTKAATDQEPNDTLPAALAAGALRGVGKK
ncbi:MAG: hypothetical protein J2P46_16140, partial [Zavarzinella sp.]|nr:hypothetical protein [Zavarzinella sp.]